MVSPLPFRCGLLALRSCWRHHDIRIRVRQRRLFSGRFLLGGCWLVEVAFLLGFRRFDNDGSIVVIIVEESLRSGSGLGFGSFEREGVVEGGR